MQPRDDENREPQKTPEAPKEKQKPRRFRIIKLEERIAPRSSAIPNTRSCGDCGHCTYPDSGCY
jgi:hypothetical protein